MSYRLSPAADRDLESIGDFISLENPAAAAALMRRFRDRWQILAEYPLAGPLRDDIAPGVRHLVIGEYLTFYRIVDNTVEILRVLHGRRHVGDSDMGP